MQILHFLIEFGAKLWYPFVNNIVFAKVDGCASFMTEASLIKANNKLILGTGPVTAH